MSYSGELRSNRYLALGLLMSFGALAEDPADFAARQVGKPYRGDSSAIGPDAFDCSGLTKAAYDQAGLPLPHHAASQAEFGRPVSGPFQRGDLLFFDSKDHPGMVAHVGIVEEGITMINAHSYFGTVRRDDYTEPYWGLHFLFARRLTSPIRRYESVSVPSQNTATSFVRVSRFQDHVQVGTNYSHTRGMHYATRVGVSKASRQVVVRSRKSRQKLVHFYRPARRRWSSLRRR